MKNTLFALLVTAMVAVMALGASFYSTSSTTVQQDQVVESTPAKEPEAVSSKRPPLFMRKGSLLCDAYGWLVGPPVDPARKAQHCKTVLFDSFQIEVMDVDPPFAYVCLGVHNEHMNKVGFWCSDTLLQDVLDAKGKMPDAKELTERARSTTMVDVRTIAK